MKTTKPAVNDCPTEHAEQVAFISQAARRWPSLLIIAIPNGGNRDAVTGARLKAEGVKAGTPDLFIPELRLWLEMKRQKGGAVSSVQKRMAEALRGSGYAVEVARGCQVALALVEAAMAAHRAKTASW